MKFIDMLQKAGIFRSGVVSGVYKNAKDRPLELQTDGVYNVEKDTVNTSEASKLLRAQPLSRQLFILSLWAGALFLVLSLASTLWWLLLLLWLIWIVFIWFVHRGSLQVELPYKPLFILLLVVSFFLVIFTVDSSGTKNGSATSGTAPQLTRKECEPFVAKYHNKVYTIRAEGLQGTIGIKIDDATSCKLHGWYNVVFSSNLPENRYKRDIVPTYNYMVLLRNPAATERTKYDGFGSLASAYRNETTLPEPFADSMARSNLYSQNAQRVETSHFYWGYEVNTNFSEVRMKELLEDTKMDIVDTLPFIVEKNEGSMGVSYSADNDVAAVNGKIVKTFNLQIHESR